MDSHTFFGYGSLLSQDSLKASAPDIFETRASYIKGFRRSFSLWDPLGFTQTNPDVAGMPFCALDVELTTSKHAKVNGILFKVDKAAFDKLLRREQEYELIKTDAYDFQTGKSLGKCLVFSANKHNGTYAYDSPAQQRYLQTCLEGAKQQGNQFYREFLETTFIGNKPLSQIKDLL